MNSVIGPTNQYNSIAVRIGPILANEAVAGLYCPVQPNPVPDPYRYFGILKRIRIYPTASLTNNISLALYKVEGATDAYGTVSTQVQRRFATNMVAIATAWSVQPTYDALQPYLCRGVIPCVGVSSNPPYSIDWEFGDNLGSLESSQSSQSAATGYIIRNVGVTTPNLDVNFEYWTVD
jgi:hypothetical protein